MIKAAHIIPFNNSTCKHFPKNFFNTGLHKDLDSHVKNNVIQNSPNLETTQTAINE